MQRCQINQHIATTAHQMHIIDLCVTLQQASLLKQPLLPTRSLLHLRTSQAIARQGLSFERVMST